MKIYFAHSHELENYQAYYEKMKDLEGYTFVFPYDNISSPINSKEVIKSSDLVLAEVSLPSTGLGVELGWADDLNRKIICVYKSGSKPSRSLQFIAEKMIEYQTIDDLVVKVKAI